MLTVDERINRIKEEGKNSNLQDYQQTYDEFNQNYSITALKKLDILTLAHRLFDSTELARQGRVPSFVYWATYGLSNTLGRSNVNGWCGVRYADEKWLKYNGGRIGGCQEIQEDAATKYAEKVLNFLSDICDGVKLLNNSLNLSLDDYKTTFSNINKVANSFDDVPFWFETTNGKINYSPVILKYLHCSFPDKFACWYAQSTIKKMIKRLGQTPSDDGLFILSGQMSLLANKLGIKNCIFGSIMTKFYSNDFDEKGFKDWFTSSNNGQYVASLRRICEYFNINIDEEYSIDKCKSVLVSLDNGKLLQRNGEPYRDISDIKSHLNKYIEFMNHKNDVFQQNTEMKKELENHTTIDLKGYPDILKKSYNIIFRGAPGTGKSYLAKALALHMVGKGLEEDNIEFVQFHPSYDYSDFVEGLRPVKKGNDLGFELKKGVFKSFCEKAAESPNENFVFIIDEINRGEISKIFGELFFSIDPGYRGKDGSVSTQYSNLHENEKKFYVPENVYIIGTMNDIDRSVDTFDFAMRRRFRFIEIDANENTGMLNILGEENKEQALRKMKALNRVIEEKLNKNYQIGAAYFKKLKEIDFDDLWNDFLAPLLQEYVTGMYDEKAIMEEFKNAYYNSNISAEAEEKYEN